jgi:hypothetical protein
MRLIYGATDFKVMLPFLIDRQFGFYSSSCDILSAFFNAISRLAFHATYICARFRGAFRLESVFSFNACSGIKIWLCLCVVRCVLLAVGCTCVTT